MLLKLRQLRKAKKLTQEELARRSGITRQTISMIERQEAPSVTTTVLVKLANALGEKVGNLFSD